MRNIGVEEIRIINQQKQKLNSLLIADYHSGLTRALASIPIGRTPLRRKMTTLR